ncbi:hypothetical protein D3C80_127900 [compost metagenome]
MDVEVIGNVVTVTSGKKKVVANALLVERNEDGQVTHVIFDRNIARSLSELGALAPWSQLDSYVSEIRHCNAAA